MLLLLLFFCKYRIFVVISSHLIIDWSKRTCCYPLVDLQILIVLQAECSGVFELRLKSFDNIYGKNDMGKCCSGKSGSNSECREPCKTSFRICLKHYQVQIDHSPCTFGVVVTPVLGGNHINMVLSHHEGFNNPIKFPFDFTWPVSSSIICLHAFFILLYIVFIFSAIRYNLKAPKITLKKSYSKMLCINYMWFNRQPIR